MSTRWFLVVVALLADWLLRLFDLLDWEELLSDVWKAVSETLLNSDVQGVLAHDIVFVIHKNHSSETSSASVLPSSCVNAPLDLDLSLMLICQFLEWKLREVRDCSFL